jgi:hypothetical protein
VVSVAGRGLRPPAVGGDYRSNRPAATAYSTEWDASINSPRPNFVPQAPWEAVLFRVKLAILRFLGVRRVHFWTTAPILPAVALLDSPAAAI